MELTSRYGLEFNPFLKNSKEILFEGAEYTEARFRLNYLANASLVIGHSQSANRITADIVMQAINDSFLG